jgi:thiamine-phosphate pyrophosphorylase
LRKKANGQKQKKRKNNGQGFCHCENEKAGIMSDTRLYLITPPVIEDMDAFASEFEAVLKAAHNTPAQIACLQIRLKKNNAAASDNTIIELAKKLLPLAHAHDCIILINDRPDLAKKSGSDGVHLGQEDGDIKAARALLGEEASIGVTCHDSRHLAMIAGEQGADYVAFGAFFPTDTKQAKASASADLLKWWVEATTLPCVAIGGITPENASPLIAAGADFIAVSSGVWQHPEGPKAAIKAFAALL